MPSQRDTREPLNSRLRAAALLSRGAYLENDPVHLVHAYADPADQEVAALALALLAFGNVRAFLPKMRALLGVLGRSPRSYALEYGPSRDAAFFRAFRSRVYTGDDLRLLFLHLRSILRAHASLEDLFLGGAPGTGPEAHRLRLERFARAFRVLDPTPVTGNREYSAGYRHLVTDPGLGGASKRWNLFLRWVARPADGVDLGIWRRVDPADLVIPLDVHVGRIAGLLGLRRRKTNDWKAAVEVTGRLCELDASDPLRFDFPLSHLGISGGCRGRWVPGICGPCAIRDLCRIGRRHARNLEGA